MGLLAMIVAAATLVASAPEDGPTDPRAAAAFERATRLYQAGDYVGAEEALAEAYAIEPQPELLYARAQMLRRQGDCERAIELYRAYLATSPTRPRTPKKRSRAVEP